MPGESQSQPERFYWDSCVLLSYINRIEDRLPVLDAMLEAARVDAIRIFASTISIVEVSFVQIEKLNRALDEGEERKLDALWLDGTITPVEVDVLISREARSLIRLGVPLDWRLRAPDAIHLATAKHLGVREFNTYDRKLRRYSEHIGCTICEPHLTFQPSLFNEPLKDT